MLNKAMMLGSGAKKKPMLTIRLVNASGYDMSYGDRIHMRYYTDTNSFATDTEFDLVSYFAGLKNGESITFDPFELPSSEGPWVITFACENSRNGVHTRPYFGIATIGIIKESTPPGHLGLGEVSITLSWTISVGDGEPVPELWEIRITGVIPD